MRKCLYGLAIAVAAASPALSADLPLKTRAIAAAAPYVDPYTGFYAGAEVGYGFNLGNTGCAGPNVGGAGIFGICDVGDLSAAPQGFVGGAFLGWGTRIPGFLAGLGLDGYLGIEGDAHIANLTGNSQAPSPITNPLAITAKDTWLASARARFGLIYQNVMFYGTVGEGWGGSTASLVDFNANPMGTASTTQTGLTWGGGIEFPWFFGPNWLAKVQYLQYDFGTLAIPVTVQQVGNMVTQKDRIDTITVGLSYRF